MYRGRRRREGSCIGEALSAAEDAGEHEDHGDVNEDEDEHEHRRGETSPNGRWFCVTA